MKNFVIRFAEHLISFPDFESLADYELFQPNYKTLVSGFENIMLVMVEDVLEDNL